jgi:hypothetical protein
MTARDGDPVIDDRPTAAELEPFIEAPRAWAWHCVRCGQGHRSGDPLFDPCDACGHTIGGAS